MLTLNAQSAKSADNISTSIRETGKYVGEITRAEKLLSSGGTKGLGLSFKTDGGQTADYLDLYTQNSKGEELPSSKVVNAILAVLKTRECKESEITVEKWSKEEKKKVQTTVLGYPGLMGKKIGFLLQKELSTDQNGKDQERMIIVGVFQSDSDLTATEVLEGKTKPEKLTAMIDNLMARPIRDSRKKATTNQPSNQSYATSGGASFDDDIPFNKFMSGRYSLSI